MALRVNWMIMMPSRTMSPEQNSWQWPGNSRSVFDAYLGEFAHPRCASRTLTLTLPWSWNTKQWLSHFFKSDVLFGHDIISGITDFPLHKLLNKYLLQEIGLPDVDTARRIVSCKTMRMVLFIFQQPSLIGIYIMLVLVGTKIRLSWSFCCFLTCCLLPSKMAG